MTGDSNDYEIGPLELTESLDAWLDEQSEALELSREEAIVRLLDAHHAIASDDVMSSLDDRITSRVESVRSSLEDDLDEVSEELATLESAVETRPSDDAVQDLREQVSELKATVDSMASADHDLAEFVRAEAIDRLEHRLDDLALDDLEHITRRATSTGIETATCGACHESIDLRLLATPNCPHCGSEFAGLHTGDGLLDEPRLSGERLEEVTD